MLPPFAKHHFPDKAAAAEKLSIDLTGALELDLRRSTQALLVLPGGSGPAVWLERFAIEPLAWSAIMVLPSDERCVPTDDERSNEAMLGRLFLKKLVPRPRFVSLLSSPETVRDALSSMAACPSHVVLGMGADGHIASLFSETDLHKSGPVVNTCAPDGLARLSLSMEVLSGASSIYLLISGAAKAEALTAALAPEACTPVSHLIRRCGSRLSVYWSAE